MLKKCGQANKGYLYINTLNTRPSNFKGKKQLKDLTESINFLSNKFKEYEEDGVKKDKIIEDFKSEIDSLSIKVENLRNSLTSKNHTEEETAS